MIFSACWYAGTSLAGWKLNGAEVIVEKPLLPVFEQMVAKGIFLSAHSPMTVQIGSVKGGVRFMSTETICQNVEMLLSVQPKEMARIVVHAANFTDRTPEEVYEVQRKTLWSLYYKLKEKGLINRTLICIENLGKIKQVGTVDDIIKLCSINDHFIPCIDLGHLRSRELGKTINTKEEIQQLFELLYTKLPAWKVNQCHIHFSKQEFTKAGEKKHVPFSNKECGPKPAPFIRALASMPESFNPVIVCESPEPLKDGIALKRNFEGRSRIVL